MSAFLTRSVQLVKRTTTGTDEYGNDLHGETLSTVNNCAWNPRTSINSENVSAREQVVNGLVLIVPKGTPVLAADAVIVDGDRYEVDGGVGEWSGSLSDLDHIEVALRRVTG